MFQSAFAACLFSLFRSSATKSKSFAQTTSVRTGGSNGSPPISSSRAGVGKFQIEKHNFKFPFSVSVLTSVFLLLVLPFTFFLIEADGFSWGPPKGIRARLYETVITCLLLLVLVVFFVVVIVSTILSIKTYLFIFQLGLFGRKDIWTSWGVYQVFKSAPLIRTAISFTAIIVLLLGLPLGQQELLNKTIDPLLLKPHASIQAQRDEINLERSYIKRRVSYFHGNQGNQSADLEMQSQDETAENVY